MTKKIRRPGPEPIKRDLKNLSPEGQQQFLRAMCRVAAQTMPVPGITEDQATEGFVELLENGFMRFVISDDGEWFSVQMLGPK